MMQGLIQRLSAVLDRTQSEEIAAEVARDVVRSDGVAAMLELLNELYDLSEKLGRLAIETLPHLQHRCGLAEVVSWLDVGVTLAGSSGAATLKYFKESPMVLGLIEPPTARRPVLALTLDLAENDPNVALEFLRRTPELLTIVSLEALSSWAEPGVELASMDYVLGIEYLRQCPSLARVLPVEHVRSWVAFGTRLVTQNSLGKTDYVGTLEFFRTSPALLGELADPLVRTKVIEVGSALAGRDPAFGIWFLAAAPQLLGSLPNEARRLQVLRYGALVAERDAEAALAYFRRCPDVMGLLGENVLFDDKFGAWFRSGMEILAYSAEGGRAYFSLETEKALTSVEQAMTGVMLRQVARQLKLFAEALCGIDVIIQGIPGSIVDESFGHTGATVAGDGRTILLPEIVRRYPTKEENARFYTILTAHEAGHLEFGTYDLSLDQLADLVGDIQLRYPWPDRTNIRTPSSLKEVFDFYPQPGLIRDLWTILEDARIEHRLRAEYPGLTRDLESAAREASAARSLNHGFSVREMVVDCLLLLTTQEAGTVRIPQAIGDIVDKAWSLCTTILTDRATAESAVRLADRLYIFLDGAIAPLARDRPSFESETRKEDQGSSPVASEVMSGQYRPVTNWTHRGAMKPELIGHLERGRSTGSEEDSSPVAGRIGGQPNDMKATQPSDQDADTRGPNRGPGKASVDLPGPGDLRRHHLSERETREHVASYDEWDGTIGDYRPNWARVVERNAEEGTLDFVDAALVAHGPSIRLLRRYFESLSAPAWRRAHGQQDGEEVDLDAVVSRIVDRVAGAELSDRIYIRREKRERDVVTAFLVDLSGSTSRQIDEGGRRVIDVEKEGLVLLCEAVGAIGDQYAIYGYSGRGRREVDFLTIKAFEEPVDKRVRRRIGAVAPRLQNRDGAAIRHATAKLLGRAAKTKLLILISDGKPLDDGYADEYALEDTKMALREARLRGIEPFCITVDREASGYLRRMYGDVRFVIIDHAGALPERLPRIYHRLTA